MVARMDSSGARRPLLMRWANEPSERKLQSPSSPVESPPQTPTTPSEEEKLTRRRLERRMATAREPALCRCTALLAYRVLDTAIVLSLLVVQGSALNFYLIKHNNNNNTYFWFIGDLAIVLVSMGAMISSYHHVRLKVRGRIQPMNLGLQPVRPPPPPSKFGVLPLTYIAWFIYSCLLVARLILCYWGLANARSETDKPLTDDTDDIEYLTPQLLRVILTLSAAVFFFQVQCYHSAQWGSTRHLAILGLSFMVVLEILDSIDLASLLIEDVLREPPISLEATVLGFASLNLVLPTFALYRLNLSDFCERSEPRILALTHITVKTIGFDLAAFILRIFLWTQCSHVSIGAFLVKNGICLLAWFRYWVPDGVRYFRSFPKPKPQLPEQAATRPASIAAIAGNSNAPALSSSSGTIGPVKGENVELKFIIPQKEEV